MAAILPGLMFVILYARDLSEPKADFTMAVFAFLAAGFTLIMTFTAWARRKNLKKIDQAGKAAGTGDSTASEAMIETKAGGWLTRRNGGNYPRSADQRPP